MISSTSTTAARTLCHGSAKSEPLSKPMVAYTPDHSAQAGPFTMRNRRHGIRVAAAASSTGMRPAGSSRDTSSTVRSLARS